MIATAGEWLGPAITGVAVAFFAFLTQRMQAKLLAGQAKIEKKAEAIHATTVKTEQSVNGIHPGDQNLSEKVEDIHVATVPGAEPQSVGGHSTPGANGDPDNGHAVDLAPAEPTALLPLFRVMASDIRESRKEIHEIREIWAGRNRTK